MKLIEKIIDKIDDNLNPILVREMRQAVQNRFIFSLLAVLLIALLAAMSYFVLFSTSQGLLILDGHIITAHKMFIIIVGFFACSSVISVPVYITIRTLRELIEKNTNLVLISAMKPGVIIRGKVFAGMFITFLLFSVSLPFMAVTYLMSGVNLLSAFIVVAMTFNMVAITILMSSIEHNNHNNVSSQRFFVIIRAAVFCLITIMLAVNIFMHGIGSTIGSLVFWADASFILILAIVLTGFYYVLSVSSIMPSSANRSLGIRLYIFSAWLATGVISFVRAYYFKSSEIKTWFICSVLIIGIGLLLYSVSEKEEQSPRVARTIPYGKIKRTAAFFFYSGTANGIACSLVMTGLTFCAFFFGHSFVHPLFNGYDNELYMTTGLFLYNYCFSISGLLIRRKFLWKVVQPKNTLAIVIALYVASFIIPIIVAILYGYGLEETSDMLFFGFIMFARDKERPELITAVIWAVIVTILSLPWFMQQVRRFAPLAETLKTDTITL
ncbi:MAG: hypothetical protein GY795_23835 [Desulfobacterales bacterium]|nr:hypothetical protein [Desulfobacterales bacterium]